MANEDDSVKSSSFAIFIMNFQFTDFICHIPEETLENSFYPEMKHRCSFLAEKNLHLPRISFFYLLRFKNKEFVMVAGSSS